VRELRERRRLRARLTRSPVERAAELLDVEIIRRFEGGLFGAVLVQRADGAQLVLKASDDSTLAPEWATGAATAMRMRARGYPAPPYAGTGTDGDVSWSLQGILSGQVPEVLDENCAQQLIGLARAHDVDAGEIRPWDELARDAAERWVSALGPLPHSFDAQLSAVLRDTADVALKQSTVVHGDFHHRNCLVTDDTVTGIFDWDIAGAGDWRFDLVCLAFACAIARKSCHPAAAEAVRAAAREECDDATAAFLMACQALRILSMTQAARPAALDRASERLKSALGGWWA
jgi:aminoglycoside phosphotransferase (APT) family kinase protein